MKSIVIILCAALAACSSTPPVVPQTVNNSTVTNYGDSDPACIMRGDFTYCRTCYQYDGMRRQSCYWTRAQ